ncbi:uncharacterized protein LOC121032732 [Herpailurus yagouaroundi]|uniref:uncharacterized protein LOC121032732 n=1 Tax=Herpailurus yagouaroundi TaxID=1608482 RepID=UPI001AD7DD58|nr:uncharacterized protein LOC121032732 [Puma yagouaroundi]
MGAGVKREQSGWGPIIVSPPVKQVVRREQLGKEHQLRTQVGACEEQTHQRLDLRLCNQTRKSPHQGAPCVECPENLQPVPISVPTAVPGNPGYPHLHPPQLQLPFQAGDCGRRGGCCGWLTHLPQALDDTHHSYRKHRGSCRKWAAHTRPGKRLRFGAGFITDAQPHPKPLPLSRSSACPSHHQPRPRRDLRTEARALPGPEWSSAGTVPTGGNHRLAPGRPGYHRPPTRPPAHRVSGLRSHTIRPRARRQRPRHSQPCARPSGRLPRTLEGICGPAGFCRFGVLSARTLVLSLSTQSGKTRGRVLQSHAVWATVKAGNRSHPKLQSRSASTWLFPREARPLRVLREGTARPNRWKLRGDQFRRDWGEAVSFHCSCPAAQTLTLWKWKKNLKFCPQAEQAVQRESSDKGRPLRGTNTPPNEKASIYQRNPRSLNRHGVLTDRQVL